MFQNITTALFTVISVLVLYTFLSTLDLSFTTGATLQESIETMKTILLN